VTPAPTPPALAIADLLEYLDDGGLQFDGQPLPDAAASELLRLQAENERLRGQVHKLEMDALDLASENSILKRAEEAELEARKPLPLSDEQIDDLHGEANRGFDIGHEEYTKAFRDAERAHGITGGSS